MAAKTDTDTDTRNQTNISDQTKIGIRNRSDEHAPHTAGLFYNANAPSPNRRRRAPSPNRKPSAPSPNRKRRAPSPNRERRAKVRK